MIKKKIINKLESKTLHGNKAESKLAKRLNGVQSIASGALQFNKGDITLTNFLIESKATVLGSITIQENWLAKIRQEALEKSRKPALCIQFVTGNGGVKKGGSWVLITEKDFQDYLSYLQEDR